MTIAAGFKCKDGIIVCSDSEVTDNPGKYQKKKIFKCQDHLIVTGAGTSDYLKMAFDKLCSKFNLARPADPFDARDKVEELVLEIHKEHIFGIYQPADMSRPEIQLIIACRCANGDLALIRTTDTACILGDNYEATGSGRGLLEYWARLLFNSEAAMSVMGYLCLFMLREVKRNITACGGSSYVEHLPKDPAALTVGIEAGMYGDREILADFPDSVIPILTKCRDFGDGANEAFEKAIDRFVSEIKRVRESAKPTVEKPTTTENT